VLPERAHQTLLLYGPIPGMPRNCLNEEGQPVRGEVGELVVTSPGLDDGWLLEGSGALPRDLLVALAGCLGAR